MTVYLALLATPAGRMRTKVKKEVGAIAVLLPAITLSSPAMLRVLLFTAAVLITPFAEKVQAQQIILLKLDDVIARRVGTKPVSDRWLKVHDYLQANHIKGSFGIITESLEKDNAMYFQWLKDVQAAGLIEFWMHGYHMKNASEPGEFTMFTLILPRCHELAEECLDAA